MLRTFLPMHDDDRRFLLALLLVIVIVLVATIWVGGDETTGALAGADTLRQDDSAATASRLSSGRAPKYYKVEEWQPELFPFDPNTADSTHLLRLGLQPWQVRNIYKYRAAGGVYRRPQDFARLYGLTVGQYRRLEPYIRISRDYQPAATLVASAPQASFERDTTYHRSVKIQETEHVVLNTADTTELMRVPGIGSYFARQIVSYGRRLGGYVSVGQLDEIGNFPPEAKHYFVIQSPAPRRLNLNQLSLNELRRHPYINYYQAKAITDYRRLHGPLHSLQDLRLSPDFPAAAISRLEPYVEF